MSFLSAVAELCLLQELYIDCPRFGIYISMGTCLSLLDYVSKGYDELQLIENSLVHVSEKPEQTD